MFQFYKEKITKYSIKINFKYFYIYIYKDKKNILFLIFYNSLLPTELIRKLCYKIINVTIYNTKFNNIYLMHI